MNSPITHLEASASSGKTLESPRGHYQSQVLLLAPERGDDAHSRTLAAHFLELGVPIELTEDWLLPTSPPRDLNRYRACLFPQSSKPRYDRDLDAFAREGGFVLPDGGGDLPRDRRTLPEQRRSLASYPVSQSPGCVLESRDSLARAFWDARPRSSAW